MQPWLRAIGLGLGVALVLACGGSVSGGDRPDPARGSPAEDPLLSPKQRRWICGRTLDMCADTWCEGPCDFRFEDLACPGDGACTLHTKYRAWSGPTRRAGWQPLECAITGVRRRHDLVRADGGLTEHYFLQVQDCLNGVRGRCE